MPECPGSVCQAKSEKIGKMCHADGFSGNIIYLELPDGTDCYCKCSCVAGATPVAVSSDTWKAMEDIKVGDEILVLDANNKWVTKIVQFSDGTRKSGSNIPYVIYVKTSDGAEIIATPEHPFLLHSGRLCTASRLTLADRLANENLNPVRIESLAYGKYEGRIHNVATSIGGPGEPLAGHLINTAGVISGDFYAQMFLVDDNAKSLPTLGSPEYIDRHGDPNLTFTTDGAIQMEVAGEQRSLFTPYRTTSAPQQYVGFLPPEMEQAAVDALRPLDDTVPLEIAEYLIHQFSKFYPDVIFNIDWPNNTVNAIAWRNGNERHVTLYGGLIRNKWLRVEGVALVIAHEIGHHYGGAPRYANPSWASCEGQADYWGALIAMREVWWGDEAIKKTKVAALQLYNFFAYGIVAPDSAVVQRRIDALGICSHPPADCRYQTYMATVYANDKPSCAGDPSGT